MPAMIGAALGFGGTLLLVRRVGPAQVFESGAPLQAAGSSPRRCSSGSRLIGVLGASPAATVPPGGAASWAARVPWELALIVAAVLVATLG